MCNITVLSIFQSFVACCLIPQYIICGHYKLLWFEIFYNIDGKEAKCSRRPCEYPCSNNCDIYNGLYTVFNCIICLCSMITSIALASNENSPDVKTRKNILLNWLFIHLIFILHLVLLHFFIVNSMLIKITDGHDLLRWEKVINGLMLMTFSISLLFSVLFWAIVSYHFVKLWKNDFGTLQDEVEKRILQEIEWRAKKKNRISARELEPTLMDKIFIEILYPQAKTKN